MEFDIKVLLLVTAAATRDDTHTHGQSCVCYLFDASSSCGLRRRRRRRKVISYRLLAIGITTTAAADYFTCGPLFRRINMPRRYTHRDEDAFQ